MIICNIRCPDLVWSSSISYIFTTVIGWSITLSSLIFKLYASAILGLDAFYFRDMLLKKPESVFVNK